MATTAKVATNRRNARRSTVPRTPEGHAVSSPNGVREITNRARKALEPSTYGFEGRCQGIWTIAYDPPRKFRLGFRRSVRSPKAVVGRTGSA